MRVWALLFAGCSFNASLPNDEPDAAIDGAPDTIDGPTVLPNCNVGVTAMPGTNRGRVGGPNGGDNFGPLVCDNATDRIVGIAIRMSNQNTIYNQRSAHGMTIACATVTIDPNTGTGTTGTPYTKEVMGSGAEMWSPSTQSAVAMCPPGQVLNGLQTHTGPNTNLFNNVFFRCARIDGTNATTVANTVIYVQGSLNEPMGIDTQNCNVNEIVTQFSNRTGSGFDSADVFCAPARCL
jgi:hypothetical protein